MDLIESHPVFGRNPAQVGVLPTGGPEKGGGAGRPDPSGGERRRPDASPVATGGGYRHFSGSGATIAGDALTWTFVVETMGLEPTTPCLQSRCSSQLSYVPEDYDL